MNTRFEERGLDIIGDLILSPKVGYKLLISYRGFPMPRLVAMSCYCPRSLDSMDYGHEIIKGKKMKKESNKEGTYRRWCSTFLFAFRKGLSSLRRLDAQGFNVPSNGSLLLFIQWSS